MVATVVSEDETEPREIFHPCIEVVEYTTSTTDGDWYDSKKFGQIDGVLVANETTNNKEVQASWATQGNGEQRVTLVPEEAATTGYLIIFGRP